METMGMRLSVVNKAFLVPWGNMAALWQGRIEVILLLNVVFEIKVVFIAKTEHLITTKQKLFPSRKVKLEEKSTGNENENASP